MCIIKAKELVRQEKVAMRADLQAVTSRVMDIVTGGQRVMMDKYLHITRAHEDLESALRNAAVINVPTLGMTDAAYRDLVESLCENSTPTYEVLRKQFRAMFTAHMSRLHVEASGYIIDAARYMQKNDPPFILSNRFHSVAAIAKYWDVSDACNNPSIKAEDMARYAVCSGYDAKQEIQVHQKQHADVWVKVRQMALMLLEEKVRTLVREHTEAGQSMLCMHTGTVNTMAVFMLHEALAMMWSSGKGSNPLRVAQDVANRMHSVVVDFLIKQQRNSVMCPDFSWFRRVYDLVTEDMEHGAGIKLEGGSQCSGGDVTIPDSPESPDASEDESFGSSSDTVKCEPEPTPEAVKCPAKPKRRMRASSRGKRVRFESDNPNV